ncbi:hypothetical protein PHYSODRAFT_512626 [Phytophthora sojae]|uniref:Uncharacterized protein n=1 Tax=Phytophthora sojae (strain P6497) TaxID=1094619 RepID=G4ZV54_PHYSP|nr:hypothetical protein PHYSODRAFT_512626 [Phytophthora sojae]EGZ13678.1 hypothetical protein PHYSODRAFT_512626 [Phytophthora sojae]|eukprot:XP_009531107.1 hypothetical protein PHYSODRAFT_512626 [Phytophthora sojae]
MLSFVPMDLKTCCQKADTNFLSRSETIFVGMPCNFQMLSIKSRATPSAFTFLIESTPRSVRGRSVMKSMEMDLQRSSGPTATNFWMDLNIFEQYQWRASVKYVRSAPGWPP